MCGIFSTFATHFQWGENLLPLTIFECKRFKE